MKFIILFILLAFIGCNDDGSSNTSYEKADKGNMSFLATGSISMQFESDYIDWFQIGDVDSGIKQIFAEMKKEDSTFTLRYTPRLHDSENSSFNIYVTDEKVESYLVVFDPNVATQPLNGFAKNSDYTWGTLNLDMINKSESGGETKRIKINCNYELMRDFAESDN